MKDRKILLVTGASSDIGMRIIRDVNGKYDKILAHYNHGSDALYALKNDYPDKIVLLQADFSDESSIGSMIDRIIEAGDYPDHIIHLSAPKFRIQKFAKEPVNDFMDDYTISVYSIIIILKAFVPYMAKQKYGKILFALTSNVTGMPAKFQSSYTVSKYALLGLMKSLSVEYADKGIMINAVSPGMVDTKFLTEIPDLIKEQTAENSPLKRNLNVDEISPVFRFLLSDDADRITGENITVNGGNF